MNMMLEQFKTIFDRPEKVKKLREVILDLAVRGKLVEQDPNDEPASVLLERIREEKERLIREKKIKREKPLAEISEQEKPYKLPQGWKWSKLGNIGYSSVGLTYSPNDICTKGISVLRSNNIQGGKIDLKDVVVVNKIVKEDLLLKKNDILICARNGSKALVGKSAIIKNDGMGMTYGAFMTIFRCDLNQYIFVCFLSPLFRSQLSNCNTTTINQVTQNILKNIIFSIPPLEEQKRIVEKVDSLMAFCDKLEQALEKKVHYGSLSAKSVFNSIGNATTTEELEETLRFILSNFKDLSLGDNAVKELKNCILQLAVQGKLVQQDPSDEPAEVLLENIRVEKERLIKEKKLKKEKPLAEISEEEKPWELPQGWMWIRLGDLTQKIGAGSTPKGGRNVYLDSGIKFIRSQNVYNDRLIINNIAFISEETNNKMSGSIVKAKDILMNITGGSIGRCCIVPDNFEIGNVNQHVSIVRVVDYSIKEFLHTVLTSPYIFNSIMNIQVGISREGLSITKLANFLIPLPPLEEQKRIVEKVDSLMGLCDELEKTIEKSKDYSNRLMESILK